MMGMMQSEHWTGCVRNCPSLRDDKIEIKSGMLDNDHELVSIFWFCRGHQRLWYTRPSLALEASRVVLEVRLTPE
jgi:hypothetical protein